MGDSATVAKPYRRVFIEESSFTPEQIEAGRLFNVFVLSLPRSGSSMMTNIVKELGVGIKATSEEIGAEKRAEIEAGRYGDGGYQMNRDGFFEITRDLWQHQIEILATPFSGCKMIIPLRPQMMGLLTFNPCAKAIMMWRDPEEIRQSQQAADSGDWMPSEEEAETQRAAIRTALSTQKLSLERSGVSTLHIHYRDVTANPDKVVREVAEFMGVGDPQKIQNAIAVVDARKTRYKAESLTENI